MATGNIDMLLKRPRTPNTQYTLLTDEQKKNIKQNSDSNAHFFKQIPHNVPNRRFYMDRYATNTSQHQFRGQPGSNPVCWVGDQWQRDPPLQHNTSRLGASLPWGPEKMGSRTYSHFDGEDVHRYLNIDVYRRPPTNVVSRVVHKNGRPGEGYYQQRHPNSQTWFGSSHVLNQTDVLQDIRPKPLEAYEIKTENEKLNTLQRLDKWPIYSEYTDRFCVRSRPLPNLIA
ncbi:uncharacterized protein [Littorina saxatilis]